MKNYSKHRLNQSLTTSRLAVDHFPLFVDRFGRCFAMYNVVRKPLLMVRGVKMPGMGWGGGEL